METKNETLNAETLMVLPINMKKFSADISESLQKDEKNKGKKFEIRGSLAFIADGKDTIMLDDECCFYDEKDAVFPFEVHKAKEPVKEEGGKTTYTISIFPAYEIEVSRKELLAFCDKPVTLKEFMGSRFRYNPRIMGNEKNFFKKVFGVNVSMPEPRYAR